MRQRDIQIGQEYAFDARTGGSHLNHARVCVTAAPSGGRVKVLVLEVAQGRSYEGTKQREGDRVTVQTARLTAPWAQWHEAALQAEEAAEQRRLADDLAEARRDDSDPDRDLPAAYQYGWSNYEEPADIERLTAAYRAAADVGPYGNVDVAKMLGLLPRDLSRDVLAATAATRDAGRANVPGTVGAVLSRCAQFLEASRTGQVWFQEQWLLHPRDVDFVNAIAATAAQGGGQLLLPPTPDLPTWARLSAPVAPMGWLRAAFSDTSGQKMHGPECHTTRRGGDDAPTMPLWQVAVASPAHICGSCGGPTLKHLIEFAHFAAAADVWEARGRTGIEPWQWGALARLLGATLVGRLSGGEPDVTSLAILVGALVQDAPGSDGWDAYYLVNPLNRGQLEAMDDAKRDAARALAIRRVNQAIAALPANLRPTKLAGSAAEADVVAMSATLSNLVRSLPGEPVLDLQILLWTLPGHL